VQVSPGFAFFSAHMWAVYLPAGTQCAATHANELLPQVPLCHCVSSQSRAKPAGGIGELVHTTGGHALLMQVLQVATPQPGSRLTVFMFALLTVSQLTPQPPQKAPGFDVPAGTSLNVTVPVAQEPPPAVPPLPEAPPLVKPPLPLVEPPLPLVEPPLPLAEPPLPAPPRPPLPAPPLPAPPLLIPALAPPLLVPPVLIPALAPPLLIPALAPP
jgi:hypothetical protein